ncbi:putative glycoside hydrolase family 61 protein [Venustampulla echinocandica]|uniref:AA9 family lytic polysaccharide monooxygenase n=1 Tax=Venustampulla echinocandica TaxID=2656787 RepID=A0A370TE80_9HELO|nr:putative glycoside hydrolase family 61 protein [Venustampulla echinocandica]RDL32993.1 putative glycoside hydrolase family 61 protein [Venustampulla echinocandica]
MHSLLSLFLAAGLLHTVAGHGGVSNYTVGDTWYRGYNPSEPEAEQDGQPWLINRKWTSIDPIFQPSNHSISCNTPGTPAVSSIPIQAGENITAIYYWWLHNVGPMITWMADCEGPCEKFDSSTGKWFKIWQEGLLSGGVVEGWWWQRNFQNWEGDGECVWPVTIPKDLKPGNYLIRHEIIALHIANKPQWYPECAHLKVSGNGTKVPGEEYLASLPGVWTLDQPEINIDIYSPEWYNRTDYPIPGPPVWKGD